MGEKIEFPIIADGRGKVAEQLGLIHGGEGTTTVRAVFMVDQNLLSELYSITRPNSVGTWTNSSG